MQTEQGENFATKKDAFKALNILWTTEERAIFHLEEGKILYHASPPGLSLKDGPTLWTGICRDIANDYLNFDLQVTGVTRTIYRLETSRQLTLAVLKAGVLSDFCLTHCQASHDTMSMMLSDWGASLEIDGLIHKTSGEVLIFQAASNLNVRSE